MLIVTSKFIDTHDMHRIILNPCLQNFFDVSMLQLLRNILLPEIKYMLQEIKRVVDFHVEKCNRYESSL